MIGLYLNTIFWLLLFLFFSMISFIIINKKDIIREFAHIRRNSWLLLALMILVGFGLRLAFPEMHLMFLDEQMYMDMASNMLEGKGPIVCQDGCYPAFKAPGWPFLISLAFVLIKDNLFIIHMMEILGSLSIPLVFLVTYLLYKDEAASFSAAAILAFVPVHIIWSNTIESNVVSVFFILLSILFYLIYLKSRRWQLLILVCLMLLITFLTRFENMILFPLFASDYLSRLKRFASRRDDIMFLGIFFTFAMIILSLTLVYPGLKGQYLTVDHFLLYVFGLFKTSSFYFLLAIPAIIYMIFGKKHHTLLYSSFFMFFVVYLPFFSEPRVALVPMIFMILIAAGAATLKPRICFNFGMLVIVAVLLGFAVLTAIDVPVRYDSYIAQTEAMSDIAQILPEGCLFISEYPLVVSSFTEIDSMSSKSYLLKNLTNMGSCIYYFWDGYCIDDKLSHARDSQDRCQSILDSRSWQPVREYSEGEVEFSLFSIEPCDPLS